MGRFARYAALLVIVLAVVGGVICFRSRQAGQGEQSVRAATVERGTMLVVVSASGNIEANKRVNLAFESSGRVDEVLVAVGDRVDGGAVLARLDTRQLELQVRQAQAALALAEAQLIQLEEGPRPGEIAAARAEVRAAEAQVESALAERDQLAAGPRDAQIAAAEAQVASAALQHRVTLIQHDRTIRESDDDEAKDQARYDLRAAEMALSAAQTQLD
ncbi:MAG TPA: biotin/lipoyl-binding protein, partial [Chloroflexi bacterium]|nr:biotin/lipoyl-binding protein [Chloroflexota bacterium]